jgi:hypothetical protein
VIGTPARQLLGQLAGPLGRPVPAVPRRHPGPHAGHMDRAGAGRERGHRQRGPRAGRADGCHAGPLGDDVDT